MQPSILSARERSRIALVYVSFLAAVSIRTVILLNDVQHSLGCGWLDHAFADDGSLDGGQARGAFGHTGVAAPLLRRLGLDGEGMNAGTEFLLQGFIHEPMTLQQGQTLELGTHHENSEVGF